MSRVRGAGVFLLTITVLAWDAAPAWAHAFGARYDLPLPLGFYLSGAGAAVALTFVIMAVFASDTPKSGNDYGTDLTRTAVGAVLLNTYLRGFMGMIGVLLFMLIVASGTLGVQSPIKNFAPTMVWVIWWVGLAFFVALVGNIWPALNPWSTLFGWASCFLPPMGRARYPSALGVWPSVVLFVIYAWLELVWETGDMPGNLVCLIAAYSALTWTGMAVFGRQVWLSSGEVFNQAFGLLGRFAPLAVVDRKRSVPRLVLRSYGAGLLPSAPVHSSMTFFVIVMLSTVTFDGFVETPLWTGFLDWLVRDQTVRPFLLWLQGHGFDLLAVVKTIALLAFPCLFLGVYLGFCSASIALAGPAVSFRDFANTLILSLVPIAIAYHVSHYLSYLMLAGQLIIPLSSDPFGWGWDLIGTAGYTMDITVINAKTVWYTAVVAIVLGHVLAVWIAHVQAVSLYRNKSHALRSQVPMLVLMVLYTMISLWILSQPIIES